MEKYLEFRCPNIPRENDNRVCLRELAGPSAKTLETYDFSHPFVDTRYCPTCGIFWEIKIFNLKSSPEFKIISSKEKRVKINFENIGDFFSTYSVIGNYSYKNKRD